VKGQPRPTATGLSAANGKMALSTRWPPHTYAARREGLTNLADTAGLYDVYYFEHACGKPYQRDEGWLKFFDSIAGRIVMDIRPATVFDAGCAMGFLVEALRQRGIEAWGVDISEYAIQNVHPDLRSYCRVASVTEPLARDYDLIVCIEVLEHLDARAAEQAIENFCRHSGRVLFSSTPHDYEEATHFNVQPPEYWAEGFARHGLFHDVDFDASFLTPWAMLFRRRSEPVHRLVREYERRLWLLRQENLDLRRLVMDMRNQLAAAEQAGLPLGQKIRNRLRRLWRTFGRA